MTEQENIELTHYRDVAVCRRGGVLNETISLERIIDYYIAAHFCKTDKSRQEISELILSTERITLNNKVHILLFLVKKYDKEWANKNQSILEKLEAIPKRRNSFAHYNLSTRIEDSEHFKNTSEITLIKFTNGITFKRYSKDYVQKLVDDIFECSQAIDKLNKDKA